MTLRPASLIYQQLGMPRSQLRELAEAGIIHAEERIAIDGVNRMVVYCVEDCERYMNGGETNND